MTRVSADARENIFMRPNDVLTVIRDPQQFIAFGATGRNEQVPFDAEGINLAQALAKAGGLLDYRADASGVFVFRYETADVARQVLPDAARPQRGQATPIVYRLNLKDPNGLFMAQRFRIFNRDLIYVSNAPLTEVEKVMQVFNMAVTPAAASASIYNVAR